MKVKDLKKEYDKLQIKYVLKNWILYIIVDVKIILIFVLFSWILLVEILQVINLGREENLRGLVQKIYGNYQRTLEKRLEYCDTVFLLDYDLETCLGGAESRIGIKRDDIP